MEANKPKRLIIIGAGGHGKVAADCAELMQVFDQVEFLDGLYPELQQVGQWQVVAHQDDFAQFADQNTCFFVAIGNNARRNLWQMKLQKAGYPIATLVHPNACIAQDVVVEQGTLILAGAVVNTASRIGAGCIVNTGATVDHDCHIANFCHIAPGVNVAGAVTLGKQVFIGIGSAVIQGMTIGDNTIVGAGSTVIRDLPADITAVGSPAKALKK